jgi:Xaa-Pro aminopeptidase
MLTAAGCQARRERLLQTLAPGDGVEIHDPKHLVYLANFYVSPFTFRANDAGAVLLLTQEGKSILLADNLAEPSLEQVQVDEVLKLRWYESVASPPPRPLHLVESVGQEVQRRKLILKPEPAAALAQLRQRKDADELDLLRLSVRAGEAGMAAARREARPGMTEMELYWTVQRAACEAIGMQALVYGDFVCGPHTEKGGGPPSQRQIAAGDLVLIDFSTVVWHYRADFAMTFVCAGTPTSRQRELHQACLEALAAGEQKLRPGVSGQEVYQAVRHAFAAHKLQDLFPHHAGHGLGLGHPEAPFLVPQSSDTLAPGQVVTLEPGLYEPGTGGIRIERNYLITETGYEVLSRHTLDLEQGAAGTSEQALASQAGPSGPGARR